LLASLVADRSLGIVDYTCE